MTFVLSRNIRDTQTKSQRNYPKIKQLQQSDNGTQRRYQNKNKESKHLYLNTQLIHSWIIEWHLLHHPPPTT